MKIVKRILIIIAILIVGFIALCLFFGDSDSSESESDSNVKTEQNEEENDSKIAEDSLLYPKLQYYVLYADEHDIELPRFKERNEVANQLTQKNYDGEWGEVVYARNVTSFVKPDSYVKTNDEEEIDYLYWGELNNDGEPDGMGVLYRITYEYTLDDPELVIKYIGYFKDGFFDGYGVLFDDLEDIDTEFDRTHVYSPTLDNYDDFNEPIYEGYFKEGYKSGTGVSIVSTFAMPMPDTEEAYPRDDSEYMITIGNYDDDYEEGEVRIYSMGFLVYEGEMSNGYLDGKGKLYSFEKPGVLEYEGEFKEDEYNGKGTLYNEDGSVEYKGEFENGAAK